MLNGTIDNGALCFANRQAYISCALANHFEFIWLDLESLNFQKVNADLPFLTCLNVDESEILGIYTVCSHLLHQLILLFIDVKN